jgi:threonylcarbamoyladenosine tRNA methylthiotransferase MtaB
MDLKEFFELIKSIKTKDKTFFSVNFGCRVNTAEINQMSQILIDNGFSPVEIDYSKDPNVILINTCSVTKKGEIESLSRVRILHQQHPFSKILVTGCANLKKLEGLNNIFTFDNKVKEEILSATDCLYSSEIKDKFSHTNRFLLKIQSGCTQFCSYCTVPFRRQYLWSLSLDKAISTVNEAVKNNYQEVIITGVNLNQYQYDFSELVEALLKNTGINLISFGSIPVNCIDDKFISLFENKEYENRLSHFLHIPIQSGSSNILKLMKRPYDQEIIVNTFDRLKTIPNVEFGTDVIVGFPGETENDFNDTLNTCKNIGFKKIHCFRYSSRPNTLAKIYYESHPKIKKEVLSARSKAIRDLV